MDTIVLQIAALYGLNVNSTRELLPAIFMKAFTDVTVSLSSPSHPISPALTSHVTHGTGLFCGLGAGQYERD